MPRNHKVVINGEDTYHKVVLYLSALKSEISRAAISAIKSDYLKK